MIIDNQTPEFIKAAISSRLKHEADKLIEQAPEQKESLLARQEPEWQNK